MCLGGFSDALTPFCLRDMINRSGRKRGDERFHEIIIGEYGSNFHALNSF
jgi:hypothetical protein